MRNFLLFYFILMIAAAFILPASAASSEDEENGRHGEMLDLFLDTNAYRDYIRENVKFVNYVRDREQSQLHLLITAQGTGGGDMEYTFLFTGRKEFEGVNDTLRCIGRELDTYEEVRSKIVSRIKLGLMKYISKTPQVDQISILYRKTGKSRTPETVEDSWNYWKFSIDLGGGLSGEESSQSYNYDIGLGANRVTHNWKLNFYYENNFKESTYDIGDREVKDVRKTNSFYGLAVKSISDRWSIGASGEATESIYYNLDFALKIAPAIEFNIFPYSQSTRRDFRFMYRLQYVFNRYDEETIYYVTEESLYHQEFTIDYGIRENWGTWSGRVTASSYLHDLDLNRLTLHSSVGFRVSEGIFINFTGGYSAIRDQVSIPRRGASAEDILLRRQQLETTYDYYTNFGISYTFGSRYSNIVNPRF